MSEETVDSNSNETGCTHFPLEKVGGRKFFLTILIVLITSVFVFIKAITPEIYQYIIYLVITIYVGGNVIQKYLNK